MATTSNSGRLGEKNEWELPHLRESHQVPNTGDFWDVKFYPYIEVGVDPIFAAVGNVQILVCRTPREKNMEVLISIIDEEPDNENFACAWSKDLDTGTPLLCVGGESAKIKIINALTGELVRVLSGHGGGINSLEISPINPYILASGSEDCSVRIWSLDPAHKEHPCAAILAGDGHRETILSTAFHATGRYLLSSGIDHVINLWVLPEFPDQNTGTHKPTRIHYPHFSTSEVHSFIVDCVTFHNDLIISKAERESCIVLWAISGFSSTNPPPPPLSAPTAHDPARDTRSAFTNSTLLYTRLIQFSIPDSDIMFMRFGLFPGLKQGNRSPVLAMCNQYSKVFFWDLSRLEEYWDYISSLGPSPTNSALLEATAATASLPFSSNSSNPASNDNTTTKSRPPFLIPFRARLRGPTATSQSTLTGKNQQHATLSRIREGGSPTESDRSTPTFHPQPHHHHQQQHPDPAIDRALDDIERSKQVWAKRYGIEDAGRELAGHREEVIKGLTVLGRQVAWSRGGEWCVIVGSSGIISIFERWGKA